LCWCFDAGCFLASTPRLAIDEDGYLALALTEHWRHVLSGAARWSDPTFFFP
jgi:hypothetical protein